jgi:hypothetical protein
VLQPYSATLRFYAYQIWLALFIPWLLIITGTVFIYKNTQKYKEVL